MKPKKKGKKKNRKDKKENTDPSLKRGNKKNARTG